MISTSALACLRDSDCSRQNMQRIHEHKYKIRMLTFQEILISVGPVPTPLISVGYLDGAEKKKKIYNFCINTIDMICSKSN